MSAHSMNMELLNAITVARTEGKSPRETYVEVSKDFPEPIVARAVAIIGGFLKSDDPSQDREGWAVMRSLTIPDDQLPAFLESYKKAAGKDLPQDWMPSPFDA